MFFFFKWVRISPEIDWYHYQGASTAPTCIVCHIRAQCAPPATHPKHDDVILECFIAFALFEVLFQINISYGEGYCKKLLFSKSTKIKHELCKRSWCYTIEPCKQPIATSTSFQYSCCLYTCTVH